MANLFSPGLTVSTRYTVRKRRELPIKGEILVKQGCPVASDSIVARAELEGELRIVRVAEELGVAPDEAVQALRVSTGQKVSPGELLAELRGLWGLFRSTVLAPAAGTIEFISAATGHVGLRAAPRLLNLPAYINGTVVEIDGERAVVIESEATFVQGIFGVGGERVGKLTVLNVAADEVVEERHIPVDASGCVLVGGRSPTAAALRCAAQRGAVGFVTGSVSGETLRAYLGYEIGIALTGDEAVTMTVILTEGFGEIAMGERVLSALRAVDGQPVSINGATQVRAGAQRPEIIAPPSSLSLTEARASAGLVVGARVRVIRVPYFGAVGQVSDLVQAPARIETGALARVLRVTLLDGSSITVPRANVELLE